MPWDESTGAWQDTAGQNPVAGASTASWSAPAPAPPKASATPAANWTNPYTTGPGLQPGQTQNQFSGIDFTQKGPSEQYFSDNSGIWQNPSFGEVNNIGLVGQYSNPNNRPQQSNNQQDWFNQFKSEMPNIATDPGLAPYYDLAKQRAAESIDSAAGARGNYGSSSAIDQNARAFADLEGQKAQNEADYNLRRLGEQRAWQGLGGQFAGAADNQNLNLSQNEQAWVSLLSKLGLDASRLGLDRTDAGADAAHTAQVDERNRGQDFFNNQLAMGDRMSDLIRSIIGPALDNDAALLDSASTGAVAQGTNAANTEASNANTTANTIGAGADLADRFIK